MKNPDTDMNDELRPEYDLQSLRVRKIGSERKRLINSSKFANKLDEYENSYEREIDRKLQALKCSYQVFQGNFHELSQWLKYLENPSSSQIIYSPEKLEIELLRIETSRLLHNFLASAKILVDHTRKIIDDLYSEQHEFNEEYYKTLNEMVTRYPIQKFIQDLRNYTIHRVLPMLSIKGNLQSANEKNYNYRMQIQINDEFRQWEKWTQPSKDYLIGLQDSIDLKSLVSEYYIMIENFYNWFEMQQQELHKLDLERLDKMEEEILSSISKPV